MELISFVNFVEKETYVLLRSWKPPVTQNHLSYELCLNCLLFWVIARYIIVDIVDSLSLRLELFSLVFLWDLLCVHLCI